MLTFKKLSDLKPESKKSTAVPSLSTLDGQTAFVMAPTQGKPFTVQVLMSENEDTAILYASGKRANEQIAAALAKGECDAILAKIVAAKRGVRLE